MCTLQTALNQAKQYPIFPCGPDKVPLVKTGFKAASQAPAQITAWWREFPNALIGIPTGKASGMLVVDIDRKNGHDGLATLQANAWSIPLTRIQQTTSGGQHVFFQYPAGQPIRCSAGALGDGIDIRADGGYVICWEAEGLPRLCEEPPAPLPDWLRTALARPIPSGGKAPFPTGAGLENPAKVRSALASLDPDMAYQDWVQVGMALHHATSGGADGFALWDGWSAQGAKYRPGETEQKWQSFGNPGTGTPRTLATVYQLASAKGWRWKEAKPTAPEIGPAPAPPLGEPAPVKRKTLLTVDEVLNRSMAHDWLVKNLLERKQLGVIYGESQSYKSLLAIELACTVALAMEWRGRVTKHGAVLYIVGEGGGGGLTRRLRAWEIANHCSLAGAPLIFREVPTLLPMDTAEVIAEVRDFLQARGWKLELIILDTLARTLQGNENSQEDFAKYQQALDTIRDSFDCAALFLHHTGHLEKDRPRGAYSIIGNADVLLQLEKLDNKLSKLVVRKMKDAESPEAMIFQLTVVELGGLDEDGNPITSVVLRHLRDFQSPPAPLKGYEAIAYNLLAKAGRLLIGDWRKAFFEALQATKPDLGQNTLKSAWLRAKAALVEKRLVFEFELFASTSAEGAKGACTQNAPFAPGKQGAKGACIFKDAPFAPIPCTSSESTNNRTYSEFVFYVNPGKQITFKAEPPITLAMATATGQRQYGAAFAYAEEKP